MDFDRVVEELRAEPIPVGAMEQTIRAIRPPAPKRNLWPVPVAISLIVAAVALWPVHKEDRAWAAALRALDEAKYVHFRVTSRYNSYEAWEAGVKFRRITPHDELRYDGYRISRRMGSLWSASTLRSDKSEYKAIKRFDLGGFDNALEQIRKKSATPVLQKSHGKTYLVYRFQSGSLSTSYNPNFHPSGDSRARWPKDGHVGFLVVTVTVDPISNRIVRLESATSFDPDVPMDIVHTFQSDDFATSIDYPATIPESFFKTPKDAFDPKESKKKVAEALRDSLGHAQIGGQQILLKALLFDGQKLYAIWDGCPCDQNAPERFKVNGKALGAPFDLRCLCNNKYRMPNSTRFSGMGETTSGPIPDHVALTLPVFAPDHTRPLIDSKNIQVGYFSKCVGWTEFKNVPVIRIQELKGGWYQTEFGQPFDLD